MLEEVIISIKLFWRLKHDFERGLTYAEEILVCSVDLYVSDFGSAAVLSFWRVHGDVLNEWEDCVDLQVVVKPAAILIRDERKPWGK